MGRVKCRFSGRDFVPEAITGRCSTWIVRSFLLFAVSKMFARSFIFLLFCLNVQFVYVSSSPLVVERAASTCSTKDIATVKRTVSDPVYFCQWWQQDVRTRSPFMEFSATQVDTLCKCISPVTTGGKCKRKRRRSNIEERAAAVVARSAASCSAEVSVQFTQPWRFCTFYTSYPRTTSPFKKYTASSLTSLCKCAITKPASTTSKKVTTTSKKTTTTSNKATTTSKKVTTTSKKITTTSNKATTTSKKATTTSTSKKTTSSTKATPVKTTVKPVTTSIKRVTSTSTRKPTVTSTVKPSTTSTKAVSSSTKKPSSTTSKQSTSSTKRSTTTSSRK
ncbi:hypothetical protein E4T43_03307 [Aureobasidium subglaciale]|nr:hypothetical protein E4T43_03307 [Aureobasidium subglaciale]